MEADTHRELADLLDQLRAEPLEDVLKAYRKVNLPSSILEELFQTHPEAEVFDFLAEYPGVPSRLLEELAEQSPDAPKRLKRIAEHPRCSRDRLLTLAGHSDRSVRLAVAQAKEATPKLLERLCEDEDPDIRAAVASNAGLPSRLQPKLVKDESVMVRAALARNKMALPEILIKLSLDPSPVVQTAAVTLSSAASDLQQMWADRGDPTVGRLVLHRARPDADALASLSLDSDPDIALAARIGRAPGLDELLAQATSGSVEERLAVLEYPKLPLLIQSLLLVDPEASVRRGLAGYTDLAPRIFTALVQQGTLSERMILAERHDLSPDMVTQFCESPSVDIQRVIAFRKGLTEDQLKVLVNKGRDERVIFHLSARGMELTDMKREVAESLAHHESPTLRRAAAASYHLLVRDLTKLAEDPAPEVRRVLARNLSISRRLLEKLARDADPAVSQTATQRLTDEDYEQNRKTKPARDDDDEPVALEESFDDEDYEIETDPLTRMASLLAEGPRAALSRMMRRVRGD